MWQRLTNPDVLIYLFVSYEKTLQRRNLNWSKREYQIQIDRLKHAKEHAHILIDTDLLSPEEVSNMAIQSINKYLSEQK
jgi:hypothetical protein